MRLEKPVGVAVAGCGRVSEAHLGAIASQPGLGTPVAVIDQNLELARSAAKKFGVEHAVRSIGEAIRAIHKQFGSGSIMRLDGSGEWEPTGGGITNAIYPTRLDVSTAATGPGVYATFTPKAKAFGLLWESHPGAGRYGFLPIQAAEYGYAGFVSTGAQSFSGEKTFRGPVNCNADFDAITTGGTYLSAATAGLRVKALVGGDLRVTMGYSAGAPDISPAYYLQVNGGAYFNGQVGADDAQSAPTESA